MTNEVVKHECLADALSAAQMEFSPVVKDKTAKVRSKKTTADGRPIEYTYQYADLSDVIDAVTPALSRHGVAQVQRFRINGVHQTLVTELRFKGEVLDSEVILPMSGSDPQEIGKIVTYFRRYALQALLGIAAERDSDGADTQHVRQPSAQQRNGAPHPANVSGPLPAPRPAAPAGRRDASGDDPAPPPSVAGTESAYFFVNLPWGEKVGPYATPRDACGKLWMTMKGPPGADGMSVKEIQQSMDLNRALIDAAPPEVARQMVKLLGERAPKHGDAA